MEVVKGTVSENPTLGCFHQSTPYWSLINRLKPFRIWLRIRRDNRFESRQNRFQRGHWPCWNWKWSLAFPNFFCLKYLYGMGIFPYEIVMLDIPFKKCCRPKTKIWNFSGVIYISAGLNDPAEIDQELINCLLQGTVCMVFSLLNSIFVSYSP
jgi:hypothetical protein